MNLDESGQTSRPRLRREQRYVGCLATRRHEKYAGSPRALCELREPGKSGLITAGWRRKLAYESNSPQAHYLRAAFSIKRVNYSDASS